MTSRDCDYEEPKTDDWRRVARISMSTETRQWSAILPDGEPWSELLDAFLDGLVALGYVIPLDTRAALLRIGDRGTVFNPDCWPPGAEAPRLFIETTRW